MDQVESARMPIEATVEEAFWINTQAADLLSGGPVDVAMKGKQAFALYRQGISNILRVLKTCRHLDCVDDILKVIVVDPKFEQNPQSQRARVIGGVIMRRRPFESQGQGLRSAFMVGLEILHNMASLCFENCCHKHAYSLISEALRILSVYDVSFPRSRYGTNTEVAIIYISLYLLRCQIVHDWKPELRNTDQDFVNLTEKQILNDTMIYLIEALKCSKNGDGFILEGCHLYVAEVLQMMGSVLQSHGYHSDAITSFQEAVCLREHFSHEEGHGKCNRDRFQSTTYFSGAPAA